MEEHRPKSTPVTEDIDIKQLGQLVQRFLDKLFRLLLRIFIYLRRRIVILIILGVIGLAIGYLLKKIVAETMKIEVIVSPNLESKNYLYDVIEEVQSNIKARNNVFFERLGIEVEDLSEFAIEIEKLNNKTKDNDEEIAFLELLMTFENASAISDLVRAEIMNRSSFAHRITFYFKNEERGEQFSKKVMSYINSSPYYKELIQINAENVEQRLKENQILIGQIDQIIQNFSQKIQQDGSALTQGRIVLDTEKPLDVPGLLSLKNTLIRDIEKKKLEILEKNEVITVLNFGRPQMVQTPFFGKKLVMIPLLLYTVFFFIEILRYLDKRAKELRIE